MLTSTTRDAFGIVVAVILLPCACIDLNFAVDTNISSKTPTCVTCRTVGANTLEKAG